MNFEQNDKKEISQNLNVWHNMTNMMTFFFLLLAFSPIALDIISLIVYTVDSPKMEIQTKKDAKKAIFTISLLSVMHIINFIICYSASSHQQDQDQPKAKRISNILNYFNQFWDEKVNLVKTQCYLLGAFIPIIIALQFRLQIIGKYKINDNISRILECHSINLITTCGFYLFLLTLIFLLNINGLYQTRKYILYLFLYFLSLTCGNIFKCFLLIYSFGIIDLGSRDQLALSDQFLETDVSKEKKLSDRLMQDNLGEFDGLKFIV